MFQPYQKQKKIQRRLSNVCVIRDINKIWIATIFVEKFDFRERTLRVLSDR